jgi:S-(hydroxymethyl)glutathione dehydrogenase/alcohol dehydrogenase
MKTKAAILVKQKEDLIIDEIDIPKIGPGKVLVEIKATRICGSQLGEIDGVKGHDPFLPHLLGHEAGAIVRDTGSMVSRVKEGDHVVCHWRPASGMSGPYPSYNWRGKKVSAGHITTFSEYSIISENRLTPINPKYGHEVSALMADTITTGFGIISNDAKVKIGQSVCIIGVGGIGLGVVLGAKLAGANPIIAIDIVDHKLKSAQMHGATHTINAKELAMENALIDILGKPTVDVVIEGTGLPDMIEKAYAVTSRKGKCVLFGVMRLDQRASINTLPLHLGKTLTGSEGGQSIPDTDIPRYLNMLDEGLFKLDDFISHRYQLQDINKGILAMRHGESTHAIINAFD